ncbi:glutathione synthase, partial [Gorgonomyces haynaldii]
PSHAPFTMYPTPFPQQEYQKAVRLQPLFNHLIDKIARDPVFLTRICKQMESDAFIQKLLSLYSPKALQTVRMGVHRADYMLSGGQLKQVEVNTISAGLVALSVRTRRLHQFLSTRFGHPKIPELTNSLETIADALAKAHHIYCQQQQRLDCAVLMVVQPVEFNIYDQRWIEHTLFERHQITLVRATLSDIQAKGSVENNAFYLDGTEISVCYFRAGYSPKDYPTENEWQARKTLEGALCIKCPSVGYQLAGCKKVQQVLCLPGMLERYMTADECQEMRHVFAELFPLDGSADGLKALDLGLNQPQNYVLKPQREGGGNNIYGQDIPKALESMTPDEQKAWILMELLRPPVHENTIVAKSVARKTLVTSELGIYGVFIGDGQVVYLNEEAGPLLRTKEAKTMEAGIAVGTGALDTPLFVN